MDDRTTGDSPHEILLALAGRIDDDLLAWCRELVAVGEDGRALELITGTLAADGTPLAPRDRAAVVAAARAARTDLDADTVLPPASAAAVCPHHFDAGRGVEHLAAAVGALPERLVAGCRTWVTFRTTPAGSAPGPLPQPVVLVEVPAGDPRPVDVLGYQLSIACARVGAPAAVEVVVAGAVRPDYQQAALTAAVAVHEVDDATPDTDSFAVQHAAPGSPSAGSPAEAETPATGIPATPEASVWPVLDSPVIPPGPPAPAPDALDGPAPQHRRYRREAADDTGPETSWDFGAAPADADPAGSGSSSTGGGPGEHRPQEPDADPPLFGWSGFARPDPAEPGREEEPADPAADASAAAGIGPVDEAVDRSGAREASAAGPLGSGPHAPDGAGPDREGADRSGAPGSDPVSPDPVSPDPVSPHATDPAAAATGPVGTRPAGSGADLVVAASQADDAPSVDVPPPGVLPTVATPDDAAPDDAAPDDAAPGTVSGDTTPGDTTLGDPESGDPESGHTGSTAPDRTAAERVDGVPAPVTPLRARTDPPRPRPTSVPGASRPLPSPIPLGRRRPLVPVSDLPRDPARSAPAGSDGPALASIGDPFGGPADDRHTDDLPTIDEADPLGLGPLPLHRGDDHGDDHGDHHRPEHQRAGEQDGGGSPAPVADDWLADWISGDWAMSRSASAPHPVDTHPVAPDPSGPDHPLAGPDVDGRDPRPAPARDGSGAHQAGSPPPPRPTPLPQRPSPVRSSSPARPAGPPPDPGSTPLPDESARLSEADRDLLARLQAELGVGDAPRPRVSRRAGIAGEDPNGRAPQPPDRAG